MMNDKFIKCRGIKQQKEQFFVPLYLLDWKSMVCMYIRPTQ